MRLDANRHPGSDLLESYSFGRLSDGAEDRIEEHLLVCEQCQDELVMVEASIHELKQGCRELRRQPEPVRVSLLSRLFPMPRPALVGAFAAVMLTVVVPVARNPPTDATPAIVVLSTSRGAADSGIAQAQARRPLRLQLDVPGFAASSYRAEIAGRTGSRVWSGTALNTPGGLTIEVPKPLDAGQYWVRLYDGDTPLQEFGLELR